jgi:histidine ammonia-lyase
LVFTADPGRPDGEPSGQAWYAGSLMSGAEAMKKAGIPRISLEAKEGLALANGATFTASILGLACLDARRLLRLAEIGAAMILEALLGASAALDPRLHEARSHPGQVAVAQRLRALTAGSQLLDAGGRLQDAYSIRCTPQIMGPAWEILDFTEQVVSRELNASTDNPLFFDNRPISGGNFHGEPLAMAADYLKIALTEIGALAERRIYRVTDEKTNFGLPPMLIGEPEKVGMESGMMMLHYTSASLALENISLAHPDSIHSLPTSAGQEDHNANATTAARHLAQVVDNLRSILAIELIAAAQALDLRLKTMPDAKPGTGTLAALETIRQALPLSTEDHPLSPDIYRIEALIQSGEIQNAVDRSLD